ncbi:hypothetical protein PYW07_010284 [Mythimna separata]|uniref:Swi5-dependent recombination DNA repair protein 1 homolog n=1 Tax=Mythimna separata TaxID=271217 RepID=A0AAD8DQF3_MYTSE|nr:hypothetical protein PYW07_010284 [Mythimna separata]
MKNVSSLKSNATNSPKTPGGISKSLLTPCRRLGLSRNWRNKGPSPFISPLAGNSQEVKEEKSEPRKRKQRVLDDNTESTPKASTVVDTNEVDENQSDDTDKTPSRNIEVPRRKKSKTLLETINKSQEDIDVPSVTNIDEDKTAINEDISERVDSKNTETIEVVSTPVRSKSKKNKKKSPRVKPDSKCTEINPNSKQEVSKDTEGANKNSKESPESPIYEIKEKSPNDLKKECVVVIQRKIFKKTEESEKEDKGKKKNKKEKCSSQALFDSDSDDTPLIELNNKEPATNKEEKKTEEPKALNKIENRNNPIEDDDFIDQSTKIQPTKVKDTKSPKNKLKTNKTTKPKVEKVKVQPKPPSQTSFDDDDDFDDNKKTILIRRTYEKVSKPLKAKSTGSITQKDIDELKARIEAKKKLLLAQSINPDTEELRNLIKKWQKGCQNALIELLDLMKTKCHNKQDMDYSEMLKSLKIPPSLVGYDAENDCFNEPSDANIILGQFEDII